MQPANLTISLLQTDLAWENPETNRNALEEKIKNLDTATDLIVLPEMFTTGFSINTSTLAEKMDGPTIAWLHRMASLTQATITGSLIIEEHGNYFNRLIWVQPDGEIYWYDKKHLFRMAQENGIYSGGKSKLIVQWKGWKICPLICYDLRFPVWSRQQPEQPYDLLLYVANWPEKRAAAWRILLAARAIENASYCAGVNRTGQDGNGIFYAGESGICDPFGNAFYLPAEAASLHTQTLDHAALLKYRERFPVHLDADPFLLL